MTDLTDKMRTCAAAIASRKRDALLPENMLNDAADLLLEASNVIEGAPAPLGEPMAILEPIVAKPAAAPPSVPRAVWITNAGDLPAVPTGNPSPRPNRVCPQCDSRTHKKVYREGSLLMLTCPACGAAWEYKP